MSREAKNNAWLKYKSTKRKNRYLIFVRVTKIIYRVGKTERELYT